ncbi:hypothetical protein PR048_020812 [Dryococelus australis]|uniref:Uncharacterized protein n=1 Tax=Dryococelus australis TaxID=614101 RepID=A0ABQ9GWG8_9NEOP|nr:hypothetical protein PR048_020812 [Dryococelus australis]
MEWSSNPTTPANTDQCATPLPSANIFKRAQYWPEKQATFLSSLAFVSSQHMCNCSFQAGRQINSTYCHVKAPAHRELSLSLYLSATEALWASRPLAWWPECFHIAVLTGKFPSAVQLPSSRIYHISRLSGEGRNIVSPLTPVWGRKESCLTSHMCLGKEGILSHLSCLYREGRKESCLTSHACLGKEGILSRLSCLYGEGRNPVAPLMPVWGRKESCLTSHTCMGKEGILSHLSCLSGEGMNLVSPLTPVWGRNESCSNRRHSMNGWRGRFGFPDKPVVDRPRELRWRIERDREGEKETEGERERECTDHEHSEASDRGGVCTEVLTTRPEYFTLCCAVLCEPTQTCPVHPSSRVQCSLASNIISCMCPAMLSYLGYMTAITFDDRIGGYSLALQLRIYRLHSILITPLDCQRIKEYVTLSEDCEALRAAGLTCCMFPTAVRALVLPGHVVDMCKIGGKYNDAGSTLMHFQGSVGTTSLRRLRILEVTEFDPSVVRRYNDTCPPPPFPEHTFPKVKTSSSRYRDSAIATVRQSQSRSLHGDSNARAALAINTIADGDSTALAYCQHDLSLAELPPVVLANPYLNKPPGASLNIDTTHTCVFIVTSVMEMRATFAGQQELPRWWETTRGQKLPPEQPTECIWGTLPLYSLIPSPLVAIPWNLSLTVILSREVIISTDILPACTYVTAATALRTAVSLRSVCGNLQNKNHAINFCVRRENTQRTIKADIMSTFVKFPCYPAYCVSPNEDYTVAFIHERRRAFIIIHNYGSLYGGGRPEMDKIKSYIKGPAYLDVELLEMDSFITNTSLCNVGVPPTLHKLVFPKAALAGQLSRYMRPYVFHPITRTNICFTRPWHYEVVPAVDRTRSRQAGFRKVLGTAVAERLDCSPPTKANTVESRLGHFQIVACWNRPGRCSWSAGFRGDLPFLPPLHSGAAPFSHHFTLIGSQYLKKKSDTWSHLNNIANPVRLHRHPDNVTKLELRVKFPQVAHHNSKHLHTFTRTESYKQDCVEPSAIYNQDEKIDVRLKQFRHGRTSCGQLPRTYSPAGGQDSVAGDIPRVGGEAKQSHLLDSSSARAAHTNQHYVVGYKLASQCPTLLRDIVHMEPREVSSDDERENLGTSHVHCFTHNELTVKESISVCALTCMAPIRKVVSSTPRQRAEMWLYTRRLQEPSWAPWIYLYGQHGYISMGTMDTPLWARSQLPNHYTSP